MGGYPEKVPELNIPSLSLVLGTNPVTFIDDAAFNQCAKTLKTYSDSNIDDSVWCCPYQQETKTCKLSFIKLNLSERELRTVKAFVISMLTMGYSPTTCSQHLSNLSYLFSFFREKNFDYMMFSTRMAQMFRSWLSQNFVNFSSGKLNRIEGTARNFVNFLQKYGLITQEIIAFLPPQKTEANIRRAPDKFAMQKLDKYFYFQGKSIASDILCQYWIHRLILSRFSEVSLMRLDSFQIQGQLLELEIPTMKETPLHQPVYRKFYRYREGAVESTLVSALQRQRAYAQSRQMDLPEKYRGYLMVSTSHPTRLLQTRDFNAALGQICEQLQLKDFEGNPVHITSHMLRHVEVCNAADTVPLEELQQACGHKTVSTTIGYGYPSVGDELRINKTIFESIGKTSQADSEPPKELFQSVLPRRFQKMSQNATRFVGNDCICEKMNCAPQYEYCITQCKYFVPDERYVPMAKQLYDEYGKRLKNFTGNSTDIEFLKSQQNIWRIFLERAKDSGNKEIQNE